VTNLYEAGDVNTVDGDDEHDVNAVDDGAADINAVEDDAADDDSYSDDVDDAGGPSGGTPLAVLEYLARSLSNDPDAVVIDTEERRGGLRLSLHVAPDDMGRVIGRRGRTAQAIRTLVNVAGAKDGVQASVDIVDD
jgi:uncharacterized protein